MVYTNVNGEISKVIDFVLSVPQLSPAPIAVIELVTITMIYGIGMSYAIDSSLSANQKLIVKTAVGQSISISC